MLALAAILKPWSLAMLGGGEPGCFHSINCLLVSGSKWWTQHSSWVRKWSRILAWSAKKKNARFACNIVSLVSFWSGVKSCGIHLSETFDIPNSLCRMFSTCSSEMPTVLAIWFKVKRLSFIMTLCTWAMNSSVVAVVGRPQLSSSRLSLPI